MPIFRRSDGTPVKNLGLVRRMMPFIMPTRNESVVYYEQVLDITETLLWIARYNERAQRKITLFHVLLAGMARGLVARPGLDRFVSGGTIYQRNESVISFAVKREYKDEAPLSTVKIKVWSDEPFPEFVERLHETVHSGRDGKEKPVDKEMKLLLRLPGFLLRLFVRFAKILDGLNLLPASMMKNDPMFASIFVANLGSVGVDRVYHHLYEWGTCSLFAAIGAASKQVMVGPDGAPAVRDILRIRWSFDERINDGHYCAASLAISKRYSENPQLLLDETSPQKPAKNQSPGTVVAM